MTDAEFLNLLKIAGHNIKTAAIEQNFEFSTPIDLSCKLEATISIGNSGTFEIPASPKLSTFLEVPTSQYLLRALLNPDLDLQKARALTKAMVDKVYSQIPDLISRRIYVQTFCVPGFTQYTTTNARYPHKIQVNLYLVVEGEGLHGSV